MRGLPSILAALTALAPAVALAQVDRDRDTIPDDVDACPALLGSDEHNGCPGDAVYRSDLSDSFPNSKAVVEGERFLLRDGIRLTPMQADDARTIEVVVAVDQGNESWRWVGTIRGPRYAEQPQRIDLVTPPLPDDLRVEVRGITEAAIEVDGKEVVPRQETRGLLALTDLPAGQRFTVKVTTPDRRAGLCDVQLRDGYARAEGCEVSINWRSGSAVGLRVDAESLAEVASPGPIGKRIVIGDEYEVRGAVQKPQVSYIIVRSKIHLPADALLASLTSRADRASTPERESLLDTAERVRKHRDTKALCSEFRDERTATLRAVRDLAGGAQGPPPPGLVEENSWRRRIPGVPDEERARIVGDLLADPGEHFRTIQGVASEPYDAVLPGYQVAEDWDRREVITALRTVFEQDPTHADNSELLMYLAALELDELESSFLDRTLQYRELEDQFDEGLVDSLPEPPGRDYAPAIHTLRRLIEGFPSYKNLDGAYYLLGYAYWDGLSEQQDDLLAAEIFEELVRLFPTGNWTGAAQFLLGEIAFEEMAFPRAAAAYQAVVDQGLSDRYERALYKLAWTYYRWDDLERAILLFRDLIQLTDDQDLQGNRPSMLHAEAMKYLAISLVDQAGREEQPPRQWICTYLEDIDRPSFERELLSEVVDVLGQQARYDEKMEILEYMLAQWPQHPDNPVLVNEVAQLHYCKVPEDRDAILEAKERLVELYSQDTPWWEANRGEPEAQEAAARYVEEALRYLAPALHGQAQQLYTDPGAEPARSVYLKAARYYGQHLARVPHAADAHERQFFLAECYYWAAEYDRAIEAYRALQAYPETEYRAPGLVGLAYAAERLVGDRQYRHDSTALPNRTSPIGEAAGPYRRIPMVGPWKTFVGAAGSLLELDPDHEGADRLRYLMGEVLYYHNQVEPARTHLHALIEDHPGYALTDVAARLLVDSYHKTGDAQRVHELCGELLDSAPLGDDPDRWAEARLYFEAMRIGVEFAGERHTHEARWAWLGPALEQRRLRDDGNPPNLTVALVNELDPSMHLESVTCLLDGARVDEGSPAFDELTSGGRRLLYRGTASVDAHVLSCEGTVDVCSRPSRCDQRFQFRTRHDLATSVGSETELRIVLRRDPDRTERLGELEDGVQVRYANAVVWSTHLARHARARLHLPELIFEIEGLPVETPLPAEGDDPNIVSE